MVAGVVEKRNRLGHTDLMERLSGHREHRGSRFHGWKTQVLEEFGRWKVHEGVIRNKFGKVNWDPIMEGGPWAMLKNLDGIPQAMEPLRS